MDIHKIQSEFITLLRLFKTGYDNSKSHLDWFWEMSSRHEKKIDYIQWEFHITRFAIFFCIRANKSIFYFENSLVVIHIWNWWQNDNCWRLYIFGALNVYVRGGGEMIKIPLWKLRYILVLLTRKNVSKIYKTISQVLWYKTCSLQKDIPNWNMS